MTDKQPAPVGDCHIVGKAVVPEFSKLEAVAKRCRDELTNLYAGSAPQDCEAAMSALNDFREACTPSVILSLLQQNAKLKAERDALAVENAALKEGVDRIMFMDDDTFEACPEKAQVIMGRLVQTQTPATDTAIAEWKAQGRVEGIHFAANRMLAAWESGFIDDTPDQAFDISGAVLSAVEFLPNASPEEFKRDYANEVRAAIAASLRKLEEKDRE